MSMFILLKGIFGVSMITQLVDVFAVYSNFLTNCTDIIFKVFS